ncbi:MAG TPA: sugar transferase [Chitinophagaceae bacterium]|nr:sugar transferase [Chitinophagaceae bacterium]
MRYPDQHKDFAVASVPEVSSINENAILARFVASQKNYLFIKRALDISFAFLLIVLVLSWLLPILAIWIKLDSKGPVFFSQKRMGRNGKIFRCFKLRTMVMNNEADERQAEDNDERITKAGRFLRKTNIDELPQLFNVLAGNMSFIGPRPHMLSDCIRFSFIVSSYNFRTLVKPGITGLAQIKGYRGPAKDYESVVSRYYWDAVYVRKAGFILDMKITWKTILRGFYNLGSVLSNTFSKK